MNPPRADRPRVGVSACLTGREVRYDGKHKRDDFVTGELAQIADLVPVCPEVEMGMGVPREPVRLVAVDGRLRMRGVDSNRDHTDAMNAWAARRIAELRALDLDGYVWKQASPSCGLLGVPLHPEIGAAPTRDGRGLFAAAVAAGLPDLVMVEEHALRTPAERAAFLARLLDRRRARSDPSDGSGQPAKS